MKPLCKLLFLMAGMLCARLSATNLQPDSIQFYIGQFQYSKALELIDREIKIGRSPDQNYIKKGDILRDMYSYDEAVSAYLNAYSFDTTDISLLIRIARTYQAMKQLSVSNSYFTRVLSLDPTNTYVSVEIATNKYLDEHWTEAKTDFLRLYDSDTANFYVVNRLANCYNKIFLPDSAMVYFNRAYALNPRNLINLRSLCVTGMLLKDYKTGITKTEQYLVTDSTNGEMMSLNAYLYLLDKQYRQSIEKNLKCLNNNNRTVQVYKNLGIAYYRLSVFDTAKTYLEQAYMLDTLDVNTVEFLSSACLKSYFKEQGIFYYERFIELSGFDIEKYAEVYKNLYQACLSWTKCPKDKILQVSLRAYQLNPESYDMLYTIAYYYDENEKDYATAIAYYKEYLSESKKFNKNVVHIGMHSMDEIIENRINELKNMLK
jgi:tetratricopeptide (TPR) repeat protein